MLLHQKLQCLKQHTRYSYTRTSVADDTRSCQDFQKITRLTVTKSEHCYKYASCSSNGKRQVLEVDKVLWFYLTIPVTTFTAERSFSSLRYIKAYLRSMMTEEHLNSDLLLHVHKEEMDSLGTRPSPLPMRAF